jgi:hypothetical protein
MKDMGMSGMDHGAMAFGHRATAAQRRPRWTFQHDMREVEGDVPVGSGRHDAPTRGPHGDRIGSRMVHAGLTYRDLIRLPNPDNAPDTRR